MNTLSGFLLLNAFKKWEISREVPSHKGIHMLQFLEGMCPQNEVCFHFYEKCMSKNWPCLLPETITRQWQSRRKWVTNDGKPDFVYLEDHFGSSVVPIADCNVKYYNSQQKATKKFSEFLSYWKATAEGGGSEHENLYLKDWHFVRDHPDYEAYEIPLCFASDWLNEFWKLRRDQSINDDYCFVYMGPKGSWTPLHADVFNSYSWSANICGVKKWIFFHPSEEENLKDVFGQLAYDVRSPELLDPQRFPSYHKITQKFEVIQNPGEVIFVPSKWLHQVHNLEDTISINHNWFNGCNIFIVLQSILDTHKKVQEEIRDCQEMEGWHKQCQVILKATYGMDFEEFYNLLLTIAESRRDQLRQYFHLAEVKNETRVPDPRSLISAIESFLHLHVCIQKMIGRIQWEAAHALFDLIRIMLTFAEILNAPEMNLTISADYLQSIQCIITFLSEICLDHE